MLKLIIGPRGSGKTTNLINLVNGALEVTKGDVVCVEKGDNLRFSIKPAARLINAEEYVITSANSLYGFIAGILASNHDVTDLFVDGTLRICQKDVNAFSAILDGVASLSNQAGVNITMTVSMPTEDATEAIQKYL